MRRIVITGMGAVSPVGNTVAELSAALHQGICGIAPITHFDASDRKVKVAGEVKNLNPEDFLSKKELRKMDRFVVFALIAAQEAMKDAGLSDDTEWNKDRCGTIVSTGVGGLGTIESEHTRGEAKGFDRVSPFFVPGAICNIAAAQIAIRYGLTGICSCVVTACAGGTNAVGDSFRMIRDGYADLMVCGGAESCITEFGIGGFTALKALSETEDPLRASIPFDKERNGFVMGEGAGILILEELEHAKARGAKIYGEIAGYGANCDAFHVTAPSADGSGAAKCMELAIADADIAPEQISYINAHGTSTHLNDLCETMAVKQTFGSHARRLMMSSTKSMTGHLLGASGAIEAIITTLAVNEQYIPPTINYLVPDEECDLDIAANKGRHADIMYAMTNSFGFGGHNASLILKQYP